MDKIPKKYFIIGAIFLVGIILSVLFPTTTPGSQDLKPIVVPTPTTSPQNTTTGSDPSGFVLTLFPIIVFLIYVSTILIVIIKMSME